MLVLPIQHPDHHTVRRVFQPAWHNTSNHAPSGLEGAAGGVVSKVPGSNSDYDGGGRVLELVSRGQLVSLVGGVGDGLRREKVLLIILQEVSW